ncbi:hypothetical protein FBQ97_02420 [Acidobacteria bacterium ACD]|nr:MAG: hypothetical protein EDX89_17600 [Acidobacteriota bacterium]MCE7956595.1 hypothetical protein [Acidobacteria bacterium ACB2]MDL1948655.1 hypothetical protein [Acidobacteria bacterium ACD]
MRKAILAAGLLLVVLAVAAPALGQVCSDANGRPAPCYAEPDPIPGPARGGGGGANCIAVWPQQCTGCEYLPVTGLACLQRPYGGKCRCTLTSTYDIDGNVLKECDDSGDCFYIP